MAYRYYDLRMNVAPLFSERKVAVDLWLEYVRQWFDPTIRLRFIESGTKYWFVMGADSRTPEKNIVLYKELDISENYERFKRGHAGEAYLRFGLYSKKYKDDVKDDALCNCTHAREDHGDEDGGECLYEACSCKAFESFQVTLLRKKKTVLDIAFLDEKEAKDDALAWNCLCMHKYRDP